MSHHVPSPRRRTPVIAALPASLPVTRKARPPLAVGAPDAPGAPASSAQDAPDMWVTAAMITPRNSHSLTELQDGRVLAAGGWDGAAPLASAELYDPARRAWTPTGAMSETRAYHTAARLPDGRVLAAGGWDLLGYPLTSTELYDPSAGAWQAASGSVTYSFCSELGWTPCTAVQAPILKVWHHEPPPTPEPEPEPAP